MPKVGEKVGNYEITGLIGRGAMATVYRAHDERLDRDVALKLLDPGYALDFIFRARFEREYRVTAQLHNDHIVPVYDAGQWDDQLYIAMMLVDGPNVAEVIKAEGPLDLARVVSIVGQVAEALDEAHNHRVVHRDGKPANILLARYGSEGTEHAYLADFGLTLGMEGTHLTRTGGFMGTLAYASPEQLNSGAIDGRADQYSLAATAYHMLVGAPPYKRDNEMALINAHLFDPVPRADLARKGLPAAVGSVIARGMAKLPERRYPTTGAFAAALAEGSGLSLASGAWGRRWRDLRGMARRLAPVAALVLLFVVAAAGGAAALAMLVNSLNGVSASPSPVAADPSDSGLVAVVSPSAFASFASLTPPPSSIASPTLSPTTSPPPSPTRTPRRSRPPTAEPTPTRAPPPTSPPSNLPLVAEGTWSIVNSPTGVSGDPYVVVGQHSRRYVIDSRCTTEDDCRLAADTFDANGGEQLGRITFRWNGNAYVYSGPARWYSRMSGSSCETSAGEIVEGAYATHEQVTVAPRETAGGASSEMTGTKTVSGTPTAAGSAAGCAPYSMSFHVAMSLVN
jgi:serine/threonine protein kinase